MRIDFSLTLGGNVVGVYIYLNICIEKRERDKKKYDATETNRHPIYDDDFDLIVSTNELILVIMYGKWRPSSLFLFIFKYITLDQIRHTQKINPKTYT